ncbi:MAG: hypothetical protein JNM84_16600 [Planctomycetes bacterium]|nr:hypothetical protein [Planctomycetota bacterium]
MTPDPAEVGDPRTTGSDPGLDARSLDRIWNDGELSRAETAPGSPAGEQRRGKRFSLLHLAFAFVPALFLLASTEGLLFLLGMGHPEDTLHLSRGFDPTARYLVPDDSAPGAHRTQMFDGQLPEVVIPPKSGRFRVAMFGGSNTQGFPHAFLERELNRNAAAGEARFEVVNLGRRGYGSTRVAILCAQAACVEPDLYLIYSGHNEFVERGFEIDLEKQWSGDWVQRTADLAHHLRTFQVLVGWMSDGSSSAASGVRPEEWKWEHSKFAALTYEQTKERFEIYRGNLRKMIRSARARGAKVLLCTLIANHFSRPYASAFGASATAEAKERFQSHRTQAHAAIPERFRTILAGELEARILEPDWRYSSGDASQSFPEGHLLRAEVTRPSLREAEWPPAEKWSPKIVPFMTSMTKFHERRLADDERAKLAEAIEHLDRALALFPDHPFALYESAACRYLHGGDDAEAARRFRAAARYDRAPRKANDAINDIVREVAREFAADPLVRFCDAEAEFSSRVPLGLIGWEWMTDDCHLHEGVRRELMRSFARVILEPWG